ncbi:FmdB family zinc ribbon protein [Candidatus Hydrogenedentota bacterium]
MPVYEYIAEKGGCAHCKDTFEIVRTVSKRNLDKCPECGAKVRRVISSISVKSNILGNSNLKEKGFKKLVRRDKGVYEDVTA